MPAGSESNREERAVAQAERAGQVRATYGWRAYALPILAVVTGLVLYQTVTGTHAETPAAPVETVQAPPTIGSQGTAIIGAPPQVA